MKKGSILVGQSGGPTAVINASLAGIIEEAKLHTEIDTVYGALNGIDGIIHHHIIDLYAESPETIELLKTTPSSILGSIRFKLPNPKLDDTIHQKIVSVFESLHITHFFYIGGNDSMDTCLNLSQYFQSINFDCTIIGVPKTIDNDLVGTDHTPGYGSSIKFIATSIAEIYQDIACYPKGKVTIVEIMGRDAGWLTAGTKLASLTNSGPDLIYLPEVPFDMEDFLEKVSQIYQQKGHALIAVSEGIKDRNGTYMLQYRSFNNEDDFGHLQLGGVAQLLAERVNQRLHLPIRSIELNLPQRCSSHISSLTDINEAYRCGQYAVQFALAGYTGQMVAMIRFKNYTIQYQLIPLQDVANFVKQVPFDFIDAKNADITSSFIDYALPLIQGEPHTQFENGMPKFAKLQKQYVILNKTHK